MQVICGSDPGFAGDGGPARDALVSQPPQTAQSPDGSLYILDQRNQRVRRIDPQGIITTVVGDGMAGFAGDGGDPLNAQLQLPDGSHPPPAGGLSFGPDGRLYIADEFNHRIRALDLGEGTLTTIVGTGKDDFSGDGGAPADAALNRPAGLDFDADGRLYICLLYTSPSPRD